MTSTPTPTPTPTPTSDAYTHSDPNAHSDADAHTDADPDPGDRHAVGCGGCDVHDGSFADQNFGQSARLEVKNSAIVGYRRQTFVKFDLTGVASAADIELGQGPAVR